MTEREIALLRTICRSDHKTYLPESAGLDDLKAFDALVRDLREMQKAGWVELEVARADRTVRGYRRKYKAAAARCTTHGREALKLLGA